MPFSGFRALIKCDGNYLHYSMEKDRLGIIDSAAFNEQDPGFVFFIPASHENLFIQTYTRKFVSVATVAQANTNEPMRLGLGLASCDRMMTAGEFFSFDFVGLNKVTVKAPSGLPRAADGSLNIATDIKAHIDITSAHVFEVIVIFR